MRKAIVRISDGFIVNVIVINEGVEYLLPEGHILIDADSGSPGDTWDGKKFVKPILSKPEPPMDVVTEIKALKEEIKKLKQM